MVSEIALSQKDKNGMIPLKQGIQTSQIQRQKVECSCQGLRGISIHWLQSFIGENGKDLNMDGEEICTTVWMWLMPWKCVLKIV